jgi:gliding motility-associated-like protein
MIEKKNVTLQECSTNGSATYKLSNAAVTTDTDIQSITYFYTPLGAANNTIADLITDFDQFNSTDTSVYARIENNMRCIAVAKIDLRAKLAPNVQENLYSNLHCDEDIDEKIDGIFQLDVTTITPFVLAQASDFIVKYYDTENKAIIGGNNNIAQIFKFTPNNNSVWIRVDATNGCPFIIKEIKLNTGTRLTINTPDLILECDNDLDNSAKILLSDYSSLFTTTPDTSVKIFANLTDAENNMPETNYESTISGPQTFYYRFKNDIACEVIGALNVSLKQPRKSEILRNKQICVGAITSLDAGDDFDDYLWSNGEKTYKIDNVPINDYWVDLYSNGCVYRQYVSVKAVELKITNIEIKGSTVTVSVTGGTPPYQYAMDHLNYQPSNIFTNVRGGGHTIYAISSENCNPTIGEINVIEAYNVISPNGDGINDLLNYSDLLKKEEPFLQIFDRLGKTVFTGDINNKYSWDGKSSGKTVSTGSYWYIMKWREPGFTAFSESSGWILVKNRD